MTFLQSVTGLKEPPWIIVSVPSNDQKLVNPFTTAGACRRLPAKSSPGASPTS
ncbi:hypothetical protein [Actinoallomurus iriomotensis]|uniref:hypothetical protein n=1 Tax=Actinoallomurus iriomotensis TaxID=478107 RepID=UPI002557BAC0|nr:hypothetical protein [Actinoallomurus iriomotensis]